MNCQLCGKPIQSMRSAYQRVTGWEDPGRGAGGQSGSSLVLREHVQEFAHAECVRLEQAGVTREQTELFA